MPWGKHGIVLWSKPSCHTARSLRKATFQSTRWRNVPVHWPCLCPLSKLCLVSSDQPHFTCLLGNRWTVQLSTSYQPAVSITYRYTVQYYLLYTFFHVFFCFRSLPRWSRGNVLAIDIQGSRVEMGRLCSQNGKRQECFPNLEDNIRMDLKEIGINTRNWVDLDQNRDYWRALVNVSLSLWVP